MRKIWAMIAVMCSVTAGCMSSRQVEVEPIKGVEVDVNAAAERLSGAIRFETISFQDPAMLEADKFLGLHSYVEGSFPLVHKHLKKEIVNELSLLYTWKGSDTSRKPIILMAHQDVVPIAAGTEDNWTHPPFSGKIADGFIWGRGTMDNKGSMMGILEAVETLLGQGYAPKRTIYLAFGHDEEVGGRRGAGEIAGLLKSRGVMAEFVLDEGGTIVQGVLPGMDKPVALIGIAEKGYMSVELVVRDEGGHSSMPPFHSAIGVLATAIHRLERNQMPARLAGPARQMFEYVAPEMKGYMKVVLGNPAIFGPVIKSQLVKNKATNSAIRTTTAVTIINAGTKENVLPQQAKAVVNFRLLPGDTREDVLNHIRKTIDDPRVEVAPIGNFSREASKVSDVDSMGYRVTAKTFRQVFPEAVVAPFLVPGGTDTKHYHDISEAQLRTVPMIAGPEDLSRAHGTDERLSVEGYEKMVAFYMQVIMNAN